MALVPVHGGLASLVNRTLPHSKSKALRLEAAEMPRIQVTDADLSTVYRIADGTLSPLVGPMNEDEYNYVLGNACIERNGTRYAWTIPLSLPLTDTEAAALKVGENAAIFNSGGDLVAVLEVGSVFAWDKQRYIEQVYGTSRTDHPGGDIVMGDERTQLVGGVLSVLPQPVNPHFGEFCFSPHMTRAMIADRGFEAALAFQTRNPLHRAHEYALVFGAEQLTRQGLYTGVVLNPLVGQLKGDDVNAVTRMKTYAGLKQGRLLGQGDSDGELWSTVGYDINDVFSLIGLDMRMFYGGPAEAVMHAIYRQNHGFSHLVIGRKHADAPYHDKTPIWGDFDAHAIFDNLAGDLQVQAVKVGFAAYYESLGRVDLMSRHPDEKPYFVSGTKVRESLVSGDRPSEKIMRSETADILIDAYCG